MRVQRHGEHNEARERSIRTLLDWQFAAAYTAGDNSAVVATGTIQNTTYGHGVQDSLYRMGEAALAAVPELGTIRMACPNKHYLPVRLEPFGLSADNMVFMPTDEPHGQIECVVGR